MRAEVLIKKTKLKHKGKTVNSPSDFEKIKPKTKPKLPMIAMIEPMFAAVGYSLIYLLFGGGLGGAFLIFIIAKMFGK